MATTPPPLRVTEPPPTPLYGAKYERNAADSAYMQAKKPSRSRNLARTPSPVGNFRSSDSPSPSLRRSARLRSSAHSPPASPLSPTRAPQRRHQHRQPDQSPKTAPGKRGSIDATSQEKQQTKSQEPQSSASHLSAAMLPTPVKTPRKKEASKKSPSVTRVLFPHGPQPVEEEAMPKPHKKSARNKGLSLESFTRNADAGADIEIFTDSRDKLPEVDASADNPFYSPGGSKGKNKKKAGRNGDMDSDVAKALEEDKGMIYVFRGQRRYRKFREAEEDTTGDEPVTTDGLDLDQYADVRPFTRSSVKPRVLFPRVAGTTTEDEEADTEIDEFTEVATPTKTRNGQLTPPTTTRGKKRAMPHEPDAADDAVAGDSLFTVKKTRGPDDKASSSSGTPFAGWRRTKSTSGDRVGSLKGKKRAAEALDVDATETKRPRAEASASF